jgi:uncharacterized protein (TIGR04255 family)
VARKYRNPPLIEAVCEFRFDSTSPWDLTIPGLVFERLKDNFPNKAPKKLMGLNIQAAEGQLTHNIETTDIVQLLHKDKPMLVQIGPGLLTVNHLQPYEGWKVFRPSIEKGLDAYTRASSASSLQRIGLRYINRFDFSQMDSVFDLFNLRPEWREKPLDQANKFIVGLDLPHQDGLSTLRIQLGSDNLRSSQEKVVFLDLDYFMEGPEIIMIEQALSWVDLAHDRVEMDFESIITEQLRERFGEIV